jgi:predicted Na+-dependent transporter
MLLPLAIGRLCRIPLRGRRGARFAALRREDVITAVFAGSQKTIAMGIPLIVAYLAGQPEVLGIAVLPIVFYHPWQLLTCGIARGMLLRRAGALRRNVSDDLSVLAPLTKV